MSLINQMLKDLEDRRRRETPARGEVVLQDLPPVAGKFSPPHRRVPVAMGALALLGLFGLIVGAWHGRFHHAPTPPVGHPVLQKRVAAEPAVNPSAAEPAASRPAGNAASRKAAPAPGFPSKKHVVAVPPPRIGRRDNALKGSLPIEKAPAVLRKGQTAKVVSGPRPVGKRAAGSSHNRSGVIAGRLAKIPHPASPQNQARAAFRRGMDDLREGRYRSGEAELREALGENERNLEARETLVAFLLHRGRISEAAAFLAGGVKVAPAHVSFREGYARLLVQEGALAEAKAVLLKGESPKLSDDPEFFALLAAISQRLGDYPGAAETYRRLVSSRPGNGVWWMGLGIALESEGDKTPAALAYRKALSCGDLNADLRRFVAARESAVKKN